MSDATVETLMQQVLDAPNDVEVRRVLADLLTERGDPRGEYIQLAIALADMDEVDPRRREMEDAKDSLEARHNFAWSAALRRVGEFNSTVPFLGGERFSFAGGFIEQLEGPADGTVQWVDEAARVAPIRSLALQGVTSAHMRELGAQKSLAHIRKLDILPHAAEFSSFERPLAQLFASPNIDRLETLRLGGDISPAMIEALAGARALDGLKELELASPIGPVGLARLEAAGKLSNLSHLRLHGCALGVEGLAIIGRLPSLRHLEITNDSLKRKGAELLAGSKSLSKLRTLSLNDCALGDRGVFAIVTSGVFGELTALDISRGNGLNGTKIGPALDAFALPSLVRLGLGSSNLRSEGAHALARNERLGNIRQLDLSENRLELQGASALSQARGLPKLETLDLRRNGLVRRCLAEIIDGPFMENVRHLDISDNKCGSIGGKAFAAWPGVPRLRTLRISHNKMGILGLRPILERAEALEVLDVSGNEFGAGDLEILSELPNRAVRHLTSYGAHPNAIRSFLRSNAPKSIERLHLHGLYANDECAILLAELPALGWLSLDHPTPVGRGPRILRERFGPFLDVSSSHPEWHDHWDEKSERGGANA